LRAELPRVSRRAQARFRVKAEVELNHEGEAVAGCDFYSWWVRVGTETQPPACRSGSACRFRYLL